jgi:hypothetical protein
MRDFVLEEMWIKVGLFEIRGLELHKAGGMKRLFIELQFLLEGKLRLIASLNKQANLQLAGEHALIF